MKERGKTEIEELKKDIRNMHGNKVRNFSDEDFNTLFISVASFASVDKRAGIPVLGKTITQIAIDTINSLKEKGLVAENGKKLKESPIDLLKNPETRDFFCAINDVVGPSIDDKNKEPGDFQTVSLTVDVAYVTVATLRSQGRIISPKVV